MAKSNILFEKLYEKRHLFPGVEEKRLFLKIE